jgi:hypothetical protein
MAAGHLRGNLLSPPASVYPQPSASTPRHLATLPHAPVNRASSQTRQLAVAARRGPARARHPSPQCQHARLPATARHRAVLSSRCPPRVPGRRDHPSAPASPPCPSPRAHPPVAPRRSRAPEAYPPRPGTDPRRARAVPSPGPSPSLWRALSRPRSLSSTRRCPAPWSRSTPRLAPCPCPLQSPAHPLAPRHHPSARKHTSPRRARRCPPPPRHAPARAYINRPVALDRSHHSLSPPASPWRSHASPLLASYPTPSEQSSLKARSRPELGGGPLSLSPHVPRVPLAAPHLTDP